MSKTQILRSLKSEDLFAARRIHRDHYKDEAEVNFNHSFLSTFVVEDSHGIVTLGGVRLNPEIVLVTDMDRSSRARHDALYRILDASKYVCVKHNYDQVYAYVTDVLFAKHLTQVGFHNAEADTLILDL